MDRSDCVLRSGWQFRKSCFGRVPAVGGIAMGGTATVSTKRGARSVRLNVRRLAPILGSVILGVAFGIGTVTWPAGAQTLARATQELVVRPGWNAVFLKVAAPQDQLEQLLRVGKVSEIVVRTTGPGTIMNSWPALMNSWPALGAEDWKDDTYLWRSRGVGIGESSEIADEDITNVAGALSAGRCYVLKSLLEEEERVTVRLQGPPVYRRQVWRGMDGSLFGAYVGDSNRPSIDEYFAPSPVLGGGRGPTSVYESAEFYTLEPKGGWRRLETQQLGAETLDENKCLFIRAPGWTDYQGPLEARLETGDALTFSSDTPERTLSLSNRTGETMEVALKSPQFVPKIESSGGDVPLPALFVRLPERSIDGDPWITIGEEGLRIEIPARGSRHLRLGANLPAAQQWRRASAADASAGTEIQSLLTLEEATGTFLSVPVSITLDSERDVSNLTGLWVGEVTVDHVVFASAKSANRRTVQPVVTPFRFRILLHRSSDGMCRLLSQAFELRKNVDGAETFALLTDEAPALTLHGNDDTELRRRFGTVAYTTAGAIPAEPASTDQNGRTPCLSPDSLVSFKIVLEHDDPRHPDIHARHPDHDNLNEGFEESLGAGIESNQIERRFSLHFAPAGGAVSYSPFSSDSRRRGYFEEKIEGIHKHVLQTKGAFELRRVSRADLREEDR